MGYMMFVIALVVIKIAGLFNIDLITIFNNLSVISMKTLIVTALVIAVIAFLLSFKISVSIMDKKEF